MRASAELVTTVLDNLYLGVYFIDGNHTITYWNKAAEDITGYSAHEMIGKSCHDEKTIAHLDTKGNVLSDDQKCLISKAISEDRLIQDDMYIKHKEGYRKPVEIKISPLKDNDGNITGAIEIFNDNVAKVDAFKKIEKLEKLVFIDSLTGVGNRRYTEIKVWTDMERIRRYKWAERFGILFVDVDDFKYFNDKYGHNNGDIILKMVSKTMMNNLREKDFVGRWGGEEFVVLVADVDKKGLYAIGEKMRSLVESSGVAIRREFKKVTISVGATLVKEEDTLSTLIKRADALMYYSKNTGKNFVTIG